MKVLAQRLRERMDEMVDETEGRLHQQQAELVARLDPAVLRGGIALTHERFLARLEGAPEAPEAPHVALGAAIAGAGVTVEALMAGYRVGAHVCWRQAAEQVVELQLPAATALALATDAMAYMDELAANSLEGFAREAAALGGQRARERQALLEALVAGTTDLDATARAAGWPLPDRLRAAVVLAAGGALDDRVLLLGHVDGTPVAVAREDDSDHLAGAALAIGPAVPCGQASLSLARARRVAALVAAGILPTGRALRWEDHLAQLVLHADTAASDALAARRLAPLAGLPPARAQLLRETLSAWLAHPGRPREIARTLHLHHQTVRYRLGRLRERFGSELDDPEARFELSLALRAITDDHTTVQDPSRR
jgi:hypothetical protein